MVTESSFRAIPVILHALGIALGILLGFMAMAAIAPDLPDDSVEPGVSSSITPEAVAADDSASLFLSRNLAPSFEQLEQQVPAGDSIAKLRIEPGAVEVDSAEGSGFALADVSPGLPELLIDSIHAQRKGVTIADITSIELVATAEGPSWYVQLDPSKTDFSPPSTYGAPLEGAPLTAGPAPPVPVAEE